MWYDDLPRGKSWSALWTDYILCGKCRGIRRTEQKCPICGAAPYSLPDHAKEQSVRDISAGDQFHALTILVNRRPIKVQCESAAGAEIKAVAIRQGLPVHDHCLFLRGEGADQIDRPVADGDIVRLYESMQFMTASPAFMGAEGRYEDWVFLRMLEREWKRPVTDEDRVPGPAQTAQPSPRATIVVLFWSYFETRIDRLFRAGMKGIPSRLADDTLARYASIGSRLDRLYRVLFEKTYWTELADLGFDDIRRHLLQVQERRNAFAHGDPSAINDDLVKAVVDNPKREHESWIAVYNRRITSLREANT